MTAIQNTDLFGFLNVEVSSDGTTLIGTFYDNNREGEVKDRFTITKSSVSTSSATDDASSSDAVTGDGDL